VLGVVASPLRCATADVYCARDNNLVDIAIELSWSMFVFQIERDRDGQ